MKKIKNWLPVIYVIIIILDVGYNLSDVGMLLMLSTPPMWWNSFQGNSEKAIVAVAVSVIIWYIVGRIIDSLIIWIKTRKKNNLV